MNYERSGDRYGRSGSGRHRQPVAQAVELPTRPKVILLTGVVGLVLMLVSLLVWYSDKRVKSHADLSDTPAPTEASASVESAPEMGVPASVVDALPVPAQVRAETKKLEEKWGIEITGMNLTAGGHGIDMRYKVLDVDKASGMLHLQELTYVLEEDSQKSLVVPFQRENQTSQKLVAGKTYFALFPNKENRVKSGGKVTLVLGGARVENLTVN